MSEGKFWQEVIKGLSEHCTNQEINTWIKPLKLTEVRGDLVSIEAPNRFYKSWIEDKYLDLIAKILKDLSIEAEIRVYAADKVQRSAVQSGSPASVITQQPTRQNNGNLNKEYTFENYVAGDSNNFVHSACIGVSEGYFQNYNPLFIYGGVGLGKTHLMHAVGHRIIQKFPKLKVLYITSEAFTNDMINSLKTKKMDEFRHRYRTIDMLLFDDVQFLAGKQRSTEEFFHTFNTLYNCQKQIIITSDKTPNEIPEMEERLRSRFAWGLIADVQSPSIEEKTAILMKRADLMGLTLSDEIALFMAENIQTENVRELIGALVRLSAFSSFLNEKISIELVKKSLERFLIQKNKIVTAESVTDAVTNYFNVKMNELRSKKRTKSISFPRQIAMFILREKLNISLQEIGEQFGGRDHSTVLHAVNSIARKAKEDKETEQIIESIERTIYS